MHSLADSTDDDASILQDTAEPAEPTSADTPEPTERAPFVPIIEGTTVILKASRLTNVPNMGKAIATAVRDYYPKGYDIQIRALGAEAANQGIKALINAKGCLAQQGIRVAFDPFFIPIPAIDHRGPLSLLIMRLVVLR